MREQKSEALLEFLKEQGWNHALKDKQQFVKGVRIMDCVDIQIVLSAQNGKKGDVKVGVYVDMEGFDTSILHKRFGTRWSPQGTVRENSVNWGSNAVGVQMWYKITGMNWDSQFGESEMRQVLKVFTEVLDRVLRG